MLHARLPSLAVHGALLLAALALSHELIYLIAHGFGEGYAAAMRAGGHDRYWTSFLLTVVLVSGALAAVSVAQIRRLRRLAAAMRASSVRVRDADSARFFRLLCPLWLRLSVSVVMAYVVLENIETTTAGMPPPGMGVLGGGHTVALPVLLMVGLLVAAVGALAGWRREVILARLQAAARARLRTAARVRRPRLASHRPTGITEGRRNGVRAPPLGLVAPA